MNRILVTIPMKSVHKEQLASIVPDWEIVYKEAEALTREEVEAFPVIMGNVPPRFLSESKELKWLQLNTAGADAYIKPGVLPKNTLLTITTGAFGLAISEHMLGMTLELMKKLHLYRDNQRKSLWRDEGQVTSIENAVTLVIGMGDIGSEFARKMKALGSYTIGVKRTPGEKPEWLDELYTIEKLDMLLPRADIVALSLPQTPATFHMMDERRLSLMKSASFLINVGRGNTVDTDALVKALRQGSLGGAALDVTDPEPLPEDHPLWSIPNAVITPHISGFYHLEETLNRICQIAFRNLSHYLAGEPLENVVDFETGYRKAK